MLFTFSFLFCNRYTWQIYSNRLLTLASVYGFWKHISKPDRLKMQRYLEMFYSLNYRKLVSPLLGCSVMNITQFGTLVFAYIWLLNVYFQMWCVSGGISSFGCWVDESRWGFCFCSLLFPQVSTANCGRELRSNNVSLKVITNCHFIMDSQAILFLFSVAFELETF